MGVGVVFSRTCDPIVLSPLAIFDDVLFHDQRDITLAEVGDKIAVQRSLDEIIAALAISAFLPTCEGVFEISSSNVLELFWTKRLILFVSEFKLTKDFDRDRFGGFEVGFSGGPAYVAPDPFHGDPAVP